MAGVNRPETRMNPYSQDDLNSRLNSFEISGKSANGRPVSAAWVMQKERPRPVDEVCICGNYWRFR